MFVGDRMNNKGFTLVEMLAVVVILGIIMGIATISVLNVIETSKKRSEKVFVDKVGNLVESYISLEGSKLKVSDDKDISFNKCKRVVDDGNCSGDLVINSSALELVGFNLSKITDNNLIEKGDMVNPRNKDKCLNNGSDTLVRVFKDSEKVYYYYADLSSLSCDISSEYAIITNIPKNLCSALRNIDSTLKCDNDA